MISCCNYLIPKEKIQISKAETPEKPFEGIAMCSVSTQKLLSLCNIEAEKMEFIVYLDDKLYGKQVTVRLDNKYDFLLNTKPNPIEAAFDIPDRAAASFLYRLKVNAKDIRKALSILTIGQKEKVNVNLIPLRGEGSGEQLLVRDTKNLRKVKIPYGEFEGTIPENNAGITTSLEVIMTSSAPFEEVITICHTGSMLYMTDGSCAIASTFAEVPKEEEASAEVSAEEDDMEAAD